MSNIGSITNKNLLLQEKVNYCSDCFHYYVDECGSRKEFELENPLSLIVKIIYQIENNKCSRSVKYIDHYLLHSHLQRNDFIDQFKEFQEFEKHCIEFKNKKDKSGKIKWLQSNNSFLDNLKRLKIELEKDMFKLSLQTLISYFNCEHDLEEHKSDMEFHSKMIASEFFFKGRAKKDINQVFNQILSRDLHRFPFPKDVKTKKDKLDRLKNRSLKEQFFGIFNLIERDKKLYTYIFKVYGIGFRNIEKLRYNKVTFYPKDHKKFDNLRREMKNKYGNDSYFFTDDDYIVATIRVSFYTNEAAKQEAISIIRSELNYLDVVFKRNINFDTNNFLATSNFKSLFSGFSNEKLHITIDKAKQEQFNNNPHYALRTINSEAKKHFLAHEHLFINAISTKNISDLWHYLETLLLAKNNSELVEDTVSDLILLNDQELKRWDLKLRIYNLTNPHSCSADILGLTVNEQNDAQRGLKKGVLSKLYSKVKYPFIQKLLKEYRKKNTSVELLIEKTYYKSIIFEAYEQRNFFIHQGIQNEPAIIKLNHSLLTLIARMRGIIVEELKKSKLASFPEVIGRLRVKAEKLY